MSGARRMVAPRSARATETATRIDARSDQRLDARIDARMEGRLDERLDGRMRLATLTVMTAERPAYLAEPEPTLAPRRRMSAPAGPAREERAAEAGGAETPQASEDARAGAETTPAEEGAGAPEGEAANEAAADEADAAESEAEEGEANETGAAAEEEVAGAGAAPGGSPGEAAAAGAAPAGGVAAPATAPGAGRGGVGSAGIAAEPAAVPLPQTAPVMLPARPLSLPPITAPFDAPRRFTVQPKPAPRERLADMEKSAALFDAAIEAAARFAADLLAEAARDANFAQTAERRRAAQRQASLDGVLTGLDRSLEDARRDLAASTDAALAMIDERARHARMRIGGAASSAHARRTGEITRIEGDLRSRRDLATALEEDADLRQGGVLSAGLDAASSLDLLATDPTTWYSLEADSALESAKNEAIVARLEPIATESEDDVADLGDRLYDYLTPAITNLSVNLTNAFQPFESMLDSLNGSAKTAIDRARDNAWKHVRDTRKALRQAVRQGSLSAETGLVQLHDQTRRQMVEAAEARADQEKDSAERATAGRVAAATGLAGVQAGAVGALLRGLEREIGRPPVEFATLVGRSATNLSERTAATRAAQLPRLGRAVPHTMGMLDAASAQSSARMAAGAAEAGESQMATAVETARALRQQIEEGTESFATVARPVAEAITATIDSIRETYDQTLTNLDLGMADAANQLDDAFAGVSSGGSGSNEAAAEGGESDSGAPTESANEFVERAAGITEDPTTEPKVTAFATRARSEVGSDVRRRSAGVEGALPGTWGPNVPGIMDNLRGMTALQAAAVIAESQPALPSRVDQRLQVGFRAPATKTKDRAAAANYLAGNNEAGALNEMESATNWWNDAARVEAAQRALSPAQITALEDMPGAAEILNEIGEDLEGNDRAVFAALREATPESVGRANAIRLEEAAENARKTMGQPGVDAAQRVTADAMRRAGTDRISGADQFAGLEPEGAAAARNAEYWSATLDAFAARNPLPADVEGPRDREAALVHFITRERSYTVTVVDDEGIGGLDDQGPSTHEETRYESITGLNHTLIDNTVRHGPDSAETHGARIAIELERPGGPDLLRMREATGGDALNPALSGGDSREAAAAREQALAEQRRAYELAWQYRNRDGTAGPPPDGDSVREGIAAELADRYANNPTSAAFAESMLRDPRRNSDEDYANAAVAELGFLLARPNVDSNAVSAAFNRLSFEQAELANRRWSETHPGEPSLYAHLGIHDQGSWWGTLFSDRAHSEGRLSGDEALRVELASLGRATNEREQFQIARMTAWQQMRESGWLGRVLAHDEYARLEADYNRLLEIGGVTQDDFDPATGRLTIRDPTTGERIRVGNFGPDGRFIPPAPGSAEELEAAMDMARYSAEAYTAAADRIATAVATAVVVVAAVVTTVLTAGAAASIWIPVLVTAGAGLLGMGLTASIKGGRYSRDEIARDFAMTIITAATAGIGAAAGTALRGGMPALRAAAGSLRVSEGAMRAALTAAGRGAAMRTTLTLFEEAMIGGVTNGLNGMGGALADPAIRNSENPGTEILHAGLRGFLGGAAGATAMRPFARFAQSDSGVTRAMGRSAGQALAGSGTRSVEIGYETARGRERRRSDEIFGDIFQAGAVGAFQGLAESGGEDAGKRYFARREARAEARAAAARRAAGEGEAPARMPPVAEAETRPLPRTIAEAEEATRRLPAADQAAESTRPPRRAPAPDEAARAPMPRSVGGDDEVTQRMARPPAFDVDDEVTQRMERPAPGTDEEGAQRTTRPTTTAEEAEPPTQRRPRSDAEPEEIQLDVGDAMMPPNPQSRTEAMEMFSNNVREDPNRECAVYVNSVTGEHVIIQGNETRVFVDRDAAGNPVGVLGEGNPQRWKQILDGGDRGEWLLVAHNHPGEADASAAGWATRLPSGRGGDLSVMMQESAMMGGAVRHSVIEVTHNGRRSTTEFAYDPTSPRPFAIIYDDPVTGQRVFRRFASMEAYGEFFEGLTGISPHLDQPGGPATAKGQEEIVLRHGTTAADAADIRRQGITIAEGKGRAQDFGAAFYLTPDAENAAVYATTRSERRSAEEGVAHTPEVLEFRLRREDLGVLVDVRPGGEHRAAWDAYLGVPRGGPPDFRPVPAALVSRMAEAGVPMPTLGDVISTPRGAEIRGAAFDHFLASIGKASADAVWGDLGGVGTGGIHAEGGGEQIAIRSPELAARLTAQLRAAAGGRGTPPPVPVPASARRPAAPRAPEPAPEPAAPSPRRRAIEGTAHEEPRVLPKARIDQARDQLRERFPLIDRMSDGAIERVIRAGLAHADEGGLRHGKRWGGAMRGQLLEEIASARVRALLDSPEGRRALGFHPDEEGLIFIEGSRIRDESGAEITDGVIARRVGEDIQIVAVVESKAGHWAAEGLVASIKGIRGMDLPDLVEGVREASAGRRAGGIMGRLEALDPGLAAALSPRAMAALDEAGTTALRDRLLAAINRLPETELRPLKAMMQTGEGQPVRDIERLLYADDRTVTLRIHDGSGNDVPVSAGVPRRPRFIGVVPSDVGTDAIAQALVGERIAFGRLELGPLAMTRDQLHAMATAMRTAMAGDFLAAANAGVSPAVAAPRPPPAPARPPVPGRVAVRPPVPARALPRDFVPVSPPRPTGAESPARRAATIGLRPGDEAIMLAGRRAPQAPREEVGGALFPPAPPRGFTQRQPTSAFLLRLHAAELEREQREAARRAGAEPPAFGRVPQRLSQCADALARAFPDGIDLQRPEDVEQLRQVLRAQRITLSLERPDGALDTPVIQALRRAGVRFMAPAR